jgi:hypothetical protein
MRGFLPSTSPGGVAGDFGEGAIDVEDAGLGIGDDELGRTGVDGDVELAQAFLLVRQCGHGLRDRFAQGANFGDGAAELGRAVAPG